MSPCRSVREVHSEPRRPCGDRIHAYNESVHGSFITAGATDTVRVIHFINMNLRPERSGTPFPRALSSGPHPHSSVFIIHVKQTAAGALIWLSQYMYCMSTSSNKVEYHATKNYKIQKLIQ